MASIVPVIVNAVLNTHHIVIDIVAFVSKGDFPRSRLGEKQRGKILGSWVNRKMRTIAQFSIRDPELESKLNAIGMERLPEEHGSLHRHSESLDQREGSMKRNGTHSVTGSMSGNTAIASAPISQSVQHLSITEDQFQEQSDFSVASNPFDDQRSETERDDFTPTDARQTQPTFPQPSSNPPIPSPLQPGNAALASEAVQRTGTGISPPLETNREPFHYSSIENRGPFPDDETNTTMPRSEENTPVAERHQGNTNVFLADPVTVTSTFSSRAEPPKPNYANKPQLHSTSSSSVDMTALAGEQQYKDTDDLLGYYHGPAASEDWNNLPSQTRQFSERPISAIHNTWSSGSTGGFGTPGGGYGYGAPGGGGQGPLRVRNTSSMMSERSAGSETSGHERVHMELRAPREKHEGTPGDDAWERDAMSQLRLEGGSLGRY